MWGKITAHNSEYRPGLKLKVLTNYQTISGVTSTKTTKNNNNNTRSLVPLNEIKFCVFKIGLNQGTIL